MASDIDAYGSGEMSYRGFQSCRAYWLGCTSPVRRDVIRSAFHREANYAVDMTLLYIEGNIAHDYAWRQTLRRLYKTLQDCQLAPVVPLDASPVVRAMAQRIHKERDWEALAVLYDALLDEGIDAPHLKADVHGRGCFVLEGLR